MPILDEHTFEFFSRSPEQTRRIGTRLGGVLEPGDLICLQGELGAGKTTLVQGMAQGWGSLDPVSSPTFVLVNEYRRPDGGRLFHMDAYRLETGAEAAELDLDWMLAEGALVVEWPERVQAVLPDEALKIGLEAIAEEQRQMLFRARGARYDRMLEALQRTMFGVRLMLLAIDTSTAQIGLGLYDGVQVIAESIWYSQRHHTVELAPALADLMQRAGVSMNQVQAVGVAIGPGSFTALRVGLAFVKGLALSRKMPILGIPTLDVLAAGQIPSKLPLAAVLQAGRGRVAVGRYAPARQRSPGDTIWQSQGPAEIMTVDALAESIDTPTLVAGELTAPERQRLARKKVNVVLAPPHLCVRRPSILAQLAWTRWQDGRVDEAASLAPIYLQLPQPIPT